MTSSSPVSGSAPGREGLTWDDFGRGVRELAQRVVDSRFVSDLVVAIARGGLLPRSIIEPDFAWRRTDKWITFCWSAQPQVTRG